MLILCMTVKEKGKKEKKNDCLVPEWEVGSGSEFWEGMCVAETSFTSLVSR